jgi:hypothetical protein
MTNADVEARHDVTVAVVREKGARFQIERASIDPPWAGSHPSTEGWPNGLRHRS